MHCSHYSGKNKIHKCVQAKKHKLCNFDDFTYELNAPMFTIKACIVQYNNE